MRCAALILALFVVCHCVAIAEDETNHWKKIESLLGPTRSLESSPKARAYLKSLTKDQTLTALRQFGTTVEQATATERWPDLTLAVMLLLEFYGEPGGGLADDAFDKLLAGIANNREGSFFRYALALQLGGDCRRHLSTTQKTRAIDTCLVVLRDGQCAPVVRAECGDTAVRMLSETYSGIILSDDAVKELRRTNVEQFREAYKLIESGKLALAAKTHERLAPWRRRIQDLRKGLASLQKDDGEPESLRRKADTFMYWLDRLPLTRGEGRDAMSPKG